MAASRATARKFADTPTTDTAPTVAPKTRLKVVTTETETNGTAPKKNSGFPLPDWAFTALENSRVNTFLCDRDGVIVWANRQAFDILGCMESNLNKMEAWRHFRAADTVGMSFKFLFADAPEEYRRATAAQYHPYRGKIKTGPCVCDVADRRRLEAKLFGGGHVLKMRETDGNAPKSNIAFALTFLQTENIPILAQDSGGYAARELHFFSDSGKVLLRRLTMTETNNSALSQIERAERREFARKSAPAGTDGTAGNITLF